MQVLILSESSQRKPRARRSSVAITYRLSPSVKKVVSESASKYGRSDNQQAEYLLKIGYLHTLGTDMRAMSDREIIEKFDEVTAEIEDND